jgi:CheY-like chemotaxis protein
MQGKGLVSPDSKPSVNMANLTRLSVLIADDDAARSWEIASLLRELGVVHVSEVADAEQLAAALRERAFDVLFCSERIAGQDGVELLRAARKSAPATRAVLTRSRESSAETVPGDVEAVQLPFSRLGLLDLLQQTASPHGGLWCEVPALSLSDILQMYHQARRSITVLLSGPVAGRVRLDSGEIVDAETGDERGLPALSRLLEAETGLIRTAPPPVGAEQTIDGPFQSVLLEAAQRLDERRRDDRLSSENDLLSSENTSVSADVLRPSVPLPFRALDPDPASFLAPPVPPARPRWGLAVAGVLLGAGLAAGAVFYLQRGAPRAEDGAAAQGSSPAAIQQTARALTPSAPARPHEIPPSPAQPSEAPAASPSPSFTLRIASKPSRATVLESGKVLGKTPLDIPISASSVARGPRRFTVRHAGYVSSRLVQGATDGNVNAMVVLTPRSAPSIEQPDGGRPDSEAAGDVGSRGRRRENTIRTRR